MKGALVAFVGSVYAASSAEATLRGGLTRDLQEDCPHWCSAGAYTAVSDPNCAGCFDDSSDTGGGDVPWYYQTQPPSPSQTSQEVEEVIDVTYTPHNTYVDYSSEHWSTYGSKWTTKWVRYGVNMYYDFETETVTIPNGEISYRNFAKTFTAAALKQAASVDKDYRGEYEMYGTPAYVMSMLKAWVPGAEHLQTITRVYTIGFGANAVSSYSVRDYNLGLEIAAQYSPVSYNAYLEGIPGVTEESRQALVKKYVPGWEKQMRDKWTRYADPEYVATEMPDYVALVPAYHKYIPDYASSDWVAPSIPTWVPEYSQNAVNYAMSMQEQYGSRWSKKWIAYGLNSYFDFETGALGVSAAALKYSDFNRKFMLSKIKAVAATAKDYREEYINYGTPEYVVGVINNYVREEDRLQSLVRVFTVSYGPNAIKSYAGRNYTLGMEIAAQYTPAAYDAYLEDLGVSAADRETYVSKISKTWQMNMHKYTSFAEVDYVQEFVPDLADLIPQYKELIPEYARF